MHQHPPPHCTLNPFTVCVMFDVGDNSSGTDNIFRNGEKFITDVCSPFGQTTHFYFFCLCFFEERKKIIHFSLLFDSKCAANTAVASYFFACDSVVVCNMSDIFTAAAANATPATIQTSLSYQPAMLSLSHGNATDIKTDSNYMIGIQFQLA